MKADRKLFIFLSNSSEKWIIAMFIKQKVFRVSIYKINEDFLGKR
jgi:hypothetical protein